eukprot:scaffold7066_cov253-Pinguiococcus_pyrenoidosus.AAC.4
MTSRRDIQIRAHHAPEGVLQGRQEAPAVVAMLLRAPQADATTLAEVAPHKAGVDRDARRVGLVCCGILWWLLAGLGCKCLPNTAARIEQRDVQVFAMDHVVCVDHFTDLLDGRQLWKDPGKILRVAHPLDEKRTPLPVLVEEAVDGDRPKQPLQDGFCPSFRAKLPGMRSGWNLWHFQVMQAPRVAATAVGIVRIWEETRAALAVGRLLTFISLGSVSCKIIIFCIVVILIKRIVWVGISVCVRGRILKKTRGCCVMRQMLIDSCQHSCRHLRHLFLFVGGLQEWPQQLYDGVGSQRRFCVLDLDWGGHAPRRFFPLQSRLLAALANHLGATTRLQPLFQKSPSPAGGHSKTEKVGTFLEGRSTSSRGRFSGAAPCFAAASFCLFLSFCFCFRFAARLWPLACMVCSPPNLIAKPSDQGQQEAPLFLPRALSRSGAHKAAGSARD